MNNETVNIWSHLLGFLYFSYMQINSNFYVLPRLNGSFHDHLALTLSVFGAQVLAFDESIPFRSA